MAELIDSREALSATLKLVMGAGNILAVSFAKGDFSQEHKKSDVTTSADKEVDAFLREQILTHYPRSTILSEEGGPYDYWPLEHEANLWIIDPLDGSINFSRKNPHFGISIALYQKGKPVLGVTRMPMKEETYWAEKTMDGAFCNGFQIHVSETDDIAKMIIGCGWSNNREANKITLELLGNVTAKTRRIVSYGSPVADLGLLAKGDLDAYIHPRLRPWDVAAGAYIVQKAGGEVTTLDNKRWNAFHLDIAATNAMLHKDLVALLIAGQEDDD